MKPVGAGLGAALGATAAVLLLASCGGTSEGATQQPPSTVTVLAAASLTEAFTELATAYEDAHPGVTVEVSTGSSTTLAQQIAEGAPADVYAGAGTGALAQLPEGYAADGGEEVLTRNVLEIAVQPGNPQAISGLTDFARTDLDTVLCAETVPCGRAADEAFASAGITATPASRELDVKATLAKVELGEADAAMVYRSDIVAARDAVEGVVIPDEENVTLDYPLVWFDEDEHTLGFVELLLGDRGQQVLTDLGFSGR
ncbi:molybdate ABC transporter substrate-binding protein [Nostocoides sp. F2B08]|uniref:molybdate ABC transporter substrate-binding protein n=1 Tax=Nostocoides sp. F2B08 TaxID=2653936 RepID=UPI00186B4D51|nr:molybdate ABC transporter substrate-binding protein [Tetrasphaera sp. F2B08]